MTEAELQEAIEAADAAVSHAQSVRAYHRRRTGRTSSQRATDVRLAAERLREAMRPLRRRIARLPYDPLSDKREQDVRDASQRLQRERRKLHKLVPTTTKERA